MKHIFKLFLCISILITSVSATEISLVDVQDTQTLSILLSEEVNLEEGIVEADVKVLKDVTIETAEKSVDDSKRVIVDFPEPLKENTTYSLLSLL